MWKRVAIFAVCALLGFSAVASAADEPFPTNYKDLVANHIKQSFVDPYSLRDVTIASPQWDGPVPAYSDGYPAWMVCFSANARNEQGGYDGIRTRLFAIRGGRVIHSAQALYSIEDISINVHLGLHEETTSWEAEGWSWPDIFWGLEEMIITTFIHAYCRDAQWQAWPEMEGR